MDHILVDTINSLEKKVASLEKRIKFLELKVSSREESRDFPQNDFDWFEWKTYTKNNRTWPKDYKKNYSKWRSNPFEKKKSYWPRRDDNRSSENRTNSYWSRENSDKQSYPRKNDSYKKYEWNKSNDNKNTSYPPKRDQKIWQRSTTKSPSRWLSSRSGYGWNRWK